MGFQFSITIGGLCMLVDDPRNGMVHVIVPAAGRGHGEPDELGGHSPHQTLLIGAGAGLAAPHVIDDGVLDLSALATNAGTAPAIPSSLMSLRDVSANRSLTLPRSFLTASPRDARVAAHIILSGGTLSGELPVCFVPRPGTAAMPDASSLVTWRADVNAAALSALPLGPLRSRARPPVPALHPVGGHVWVGVVSLPSAFVPKPTDPADLYHPRLEYTPDHFGMFWTFWSGVSGAPARCTGTSPFKSAFATHPRVCTGCWVPAA